MIAVNDGNRRSAVINARTDKVGCGQKQLNDWLTGIAMPDQRPHLKPRHARGAASSWHCLPQGELPYLRTVQRGGNQTRSAQVTAAATAAPSATPSAPTASPRHPARRRGIVTRRRPVRPAQHADGAGRGRAAAGGSGRGHAGRAPRSAPSVFLAFASTAAGTRVTTRPPHRSRRAAFPHRAPTSGV